MNSALIKLWREIRSAPLGSGFGFLRLSILHPFSWLYRLGVALDIAFTRRVKLENVSVISVGNLTAGGTGKTPFVEFLVRELSAVKVPARLRVGIVGSGYGRSSQDTVIGLGSEFASRAVSEVGDEMAMLAQNLRSTWFAVDSDKLKAARELAEKKVVDVIVIDDGFQTRRLKRDLDIVLLNSESEAADYRLLPAGLMREPLSALRRADILVGAKLSSADSPVPELIREVLSQSGVDSAVGVEGAGFYRSYNEFKLECVSGAGGAEDNPAVLAVLGVAGKSVVLVSGLADNLSFRRTVEALGAQIGETIEFADHFRYDGEWISKIQARVREGGHSALITSAKDWVKLREFEWETPVWVALQKTRVVGESDLMKQILARLG